MARAIDPYWRIESRTSRIAPALPVDRLLGLCARGDVRPELTRAIERAARNYPRWETFATVAEAHGIGPLAHMQLEASNAEVPVAVRRVLIGSKMRHARLNGLRASLLAEMNHALVTRGIPMLALKGGALAFSVYESPHHRAMRDLDVLVRSEHVRDAGRVLKELGYLVNADEETWATVSSHFHQAPTRIRVVDGARIAVEVHRRLNVPFKRIPRTYDALASRATVVEVANERVRTLGPTDNLFHVYFHGFAMPLGWSDRLRLVSAADVFALVIHRCDQIDWGALHRQWPRLREALAWFELLSPWPEEVRRPLELPHVPVDDGLDGHDYRGWPREELGERKGELRGHILDTLNPEPWWQRLRYGGSSGFSGRVRCYTRHVRDVLRF